MLFSKRTLLTAVAVSLSGSLSFTQPARQELTLAAKKIVIDNLSRLLLNNYIFADTAFKMANYIKLQLTTGKYDRTDKSADFAVRLTTDLRSVYNDKHLSVEYDANPENAAAQSSYIAQAAKLMEAAETARQQNYGFSKTAVLNGNIGYIALNGFFDLNDKSSQTVNSAFDLLRNVNTLIIDLRLNGGGQADMVHYISSLFLKERTHLNDFYVRKTNTLQRNWSAPRAQSDIWGNVPLYILVSSYTCSAAEEFAYDMQCLHRAVIVGEVTQGAAHPAERLSIGNGFSVNIPFARPINPVTKTNWEICGVKPDISVKANKALDEAIQIIFQRQAASSDSLTSKNAKWLYFIYKAKHHPYKLNLQSLKRFAGNYAGNKITLEQGNQLFYTSSTDYKVKLIAISKTTFLLDAEFDNRELIFHYGKKEGSDKMYFNLDGSLSAGFIKY